MEIELADLRARYALLSDEAVREAYLLGPESYTPQAWEVITDELKSRGIRSDSSELDVKPIAESPRPVSPYFFYSHFIQHQTWNPSQELPDLGLKILGYFWLFSGALGTWWGLRTLRDAWAGQAMDEFVFVLVILLVSIGMTLAAAFAAIQFRRPWGWYLLLFLTVVSPLLRVLERTASNVAWLVVLFFPIYLCILPFYVARRRRTFGLEPYPWAL